jgi:Sulfatase
MMHKFLSRLLGGAAAALFATTSLTPTSQAQAPAPTLAPAPAQPQQQRPNIVMLMTDDTGWNDFGAYSGGGAALGHPTPNVDQIAREGAVFTCWVWAGELHRRTRLVPDGTLPDPLGAVDRGGAG